jgi:hypothetical protein
MTTPQIKAPTKKGLSLSENAAFYQRQNQEVRTVREIKRS